MTAEPAQNYQDSRLYEDVDSLPISLYEPERSRLYHDSKEDLDSEVESQYADYGLN
ncbi:hypothetical protein HYW76_00400 [Candidatus Pacearchaeota archaeon]|nr:hypothetical protein [Candidatus Pacearchaeota archaeon]